MTTFPPSGYTPAASSGGGPTPSATATPSAPSSPVLITLDGSLSTGTGALTYAWVLYGPNGVETALLSDAAAVSPTFTPTAMGGWTAILTVTDVHGSAVDTAAIQVGVAPKAGVGFDVAQQRAIANRGAVDRGTPFDITGATIV